MRMSREATAQSRERIVGAAAKMVRERGVEATSIADVMEAAGMTNGGFYRHFRSKEELIAAAIRAAFDEIADRFDRRLRQNGAAASVEAYVDEYLSMYHVEHPGRGCPVAAIGADAGRCRGAFAEEFVAGAERLIGRLSDAGGFGTAPELTKERDQERTKAIRRLATLVGAIVIARAVGPGALRDEVIDVVR
jgi:TetR/AcrR family transcriptional repressor of nem operon